MFLFKCIISAGVVGCLRGGFDRRRCAWDRRVRAANPSCLSDVDSQGTHPKGVSSNSSVRKRADGLRSAAHPRFVIIWFFQIMLFLIRCIFAVSVGYIGACGLPRLIRALGFGPTGVLPNTAASKLQGRYKGVVPKSGYFGVLQKWGVSGVPQWLTLAVFFVATGIGPVGCPKKAGPIGADVLAKAGSSHSCFCSVDIQGTPPAIGCEIPPNGDDGPDIFHHYIWLDLCTFDMAPEISGPLLQFPIDLYRQMRLHGNQSNLLISPWLATFLLVMVHQGARGDTATKITRLLHASYCPWRKGELLERFLRWTRDLPAGTLGPRQGRSGLRLTRYACLYYDETVKLTDEYVAAMGKAGVNCHRKDFACSAEQCRLSMDAFARAMSSYTISPSWSSASARGRQQGNAADFCWALLDSRFAGGVASRRLRMGSSSRREPGLPSSP
ncbi:hypothetical protein MRX96_001208 [Rhipicephalus microplus]